MRKLLPLLLLFCLPAQAAITYVGATSNDNSGGTDIALTLPGHSTDDFAVAVCAGSDTGTNPVYALTVATGWTAHRNDNQTATGDADMQSYVWYKKFTSGAETNPTFTNDTANAWKCMVIIFAGVDTSTAFDATPTYTSGENAANPTNAAITTVTANATLLITHTFNANDISACGVPSGYTQSRCRISSVAAQRGYAAAYDLDVGATPGTNPGVWTHTASPTNMEDYQLYTFALRPASTGSPLRRRRSN